MPLVHYSEIATRFTHIDATFVAYSLSKPEKNPFFQVKFYPWWEHPRVIEQIASTGTWTPYKTSLDSEKIVTVYPLDIVDVSLDNDLDVTDWGFTRDHLFLWGYENHSQILCNSRLSVEQWYDILTEVEHELNIPAGEAEVLNGVVRQVHKWGGRGSFELGNFPRSVWLPVYKALIKRDISVWTHGEPEAVELPVLLLMDERNYIIAGDFEVDVPEFKHLLD